MPNFCVFNQTNLLTPTHRQTRKYHQFDLRDLLPKFLRFSLPILIWPASAMSTARVANAQIIPDSTLPQNSRIVPTGTTVQIEGGTRAGNNLFHSFTEFSIPTGSAAFFNNSLDVQSIISRVSGGSISNIDGLIRANGSANLFLINPNGIIFGPNAQLNLGGSFFATTANSIEFADGKIYSATETTSPLLSVNVPMGLQFGQNPAPILNQSQAQSAFPLPPLDPQIPIPTNVGLQVIPGQTLALIGGDVRLNNGNLTAFSGQIELGAVRTPGVVKLTSTPVGWQVRYDGIESFGNINLSNHSAVITSGLRGGGIRLQGGDIGISDGSRLAAETFGDFDGAGIDIQADRFTLQNRSFLSTSTFGAGAGGAMNIRGNTIELIGTTPLSLSRQLLSGTFNPFDLADGFYSFSAGSGTAGGITINARKIGVREGANIVTTTFISGAGGDLNITASESAEFTNGSLLVTGTTGLGDAGDLEIATNILRVLNGTSLSSTPNQTGEGQGGDLRVRANFVELIGTPVGAVVPNGLFTTTLGGGNAGDLLLESDRLIVRGGAQVSAASAGAGRGGNLAVRSREIELSGISADGRFLSGLFTSSSLLTVAGQQGGAPAGSLSVSAEQLSVRDGAQISAATGSQGAAGNLSVQVSEQVEVSGFATNVDPNVEAVSFGVVGDGIVPSAIEANTSGAGNAGDLTIATGTLIVREGAEVGVRGTASGAAGNLEVFAQSIQLEDEGALSASTVAGTGGNISLSAPEIRLRGGSRITTNTGNTDGGNIAIATDTLVALENSDISANAQLGRGGQVIINAQGIFGIAFRAEATPASDITATSNLGPQFSGVVELNTPDVDPSQGLVELPAEITDPADQIAAGCAADQGNEFVITGRGGLPEDPTQTLRGRSVWRDLRPIEGIGTTPPNRGDAQMPTLPVQGRNFVPPAATHLQTPLVEAQGWAIAPNGAVVLVTQPVNVSSERSWYQPAHCGDV